MDLIGLIIDGHGAKIVITIIVRGWMMHESMKDTIFDSIVGMV